MKKDTYIEKYTKEMEKLFTEYKNNPSDKTAYDMICVVTSFVSIGYKLPLGYTFYASKEPILDLFTPEQIRGEDVGKEV